MENMVLKVVTPGGEAVNVDCDSVQLRIPDDASGNHGGWLGIRRGHADSLMALAPGKVQARLNGALVAETFVSGGIAFVADNVVTVLAEETQ